MLLSLFVRGTGTAGAAALLSSAQDEVQEAAAEWLRRCMGSCRLVPAGAAWWVSHGYQASGL